MGLIHLSHALICTHMLSHVHHTHTCPHLHTHGCAVWVYGQRLCSPDIARFAPSMHTQPSSVAACGFGMKPQPQYICFGLCYAWCEKWGGGLSYHIGGRDSLVKELNISRNRLLALKITV